MNAEEVYEFLATHLEVLVEDVSYPPSCGGEVDGITRVKVSLVLSHPSTGQKVVISQDKCSLP
jgi:hypothetical protein